MRRSVVDSQLDRWQLWSAITDCFKGETELTPSSLKLLMDTAGIHNFDHNWFCQFVNAGIISKSTVKNKYVLQKPCPIPYNDRTKELPGVLGYQISLISRTRKKTVQEIMAEPEPVHQHQQPSIPTSLIPKREYDMMQDIKNLQKELSATKIELQRSKEVLDTLYREQLLYKEKVNKLCSIQEAFTNLVNALL